MRIIKNRVFQNYLILLITLLMIEIFFSYLNASSIFNISFIRIFILLNIIAILLGYITSLFKTKITYILNSFLIFIFSFYVWLQLGFNNFLGVYMSLNTSSQFGAVKSYIKDFLKSMHISYYLIFIPFILLISFYILINYLTDKYPDKFRLKIRLKYQNTIIFLITLISLTSFSGIFYFSLDNNFSKDSYQVISNKDLFLTASNPSLCVKEFGIISFAFLDIHSRTSNTSDNNLLYFAYNTEEKKDYSRNIDDIAWHTLIDEETNQNYNNLNTYFINNKITSKNDYTALFKNKNLIVIMLESVNDIIYNKDYFPNFYNLATNGWYFENNYSPRNSCATGNNEFSALTGIYSIYNNCTTNVYANNKYFTGLFNLFNNKGYYTNSLHNYTEQYYSRKITHPNLGSQKYYGVDSLNIDYSNVYGQWSSDEDFIDAYLKIIDQGDKDKHFMSYLTTVTSHQPYNDSSKYGDMYLDMTKDTKYSMEMRRYLSKLKVVDNAIGKLVDGLKERNLLDDTVIVLFGDHYPYGLNLDTINEVLDRDLNNYENEKVPFVIYNPTLKKETFEIYTSYINLTPTLANLFDLEFDPRLYAGVDIFSEDYNNTIVFPDYSWKNDKAFYNALSGKITYLTDYTYTDEEIKNLNSYFYAKMNSSTLAIKYNYFNYLDINLKEIKERNNV